MGRPEPCVLFAQTFVHPQLDEYIDEVTFAEPVVITACEFLEQNASSASHSVSLVGATLPPSFALEVFVHCEGEIRFRRLCQPFLYSHSSSNVLEVEAIVTNHLVVRGSYRSLSLVIYGNTAEDLGQFNIEFDDSSLTNLVNSSEGNLEDLPLPLHCINRIGETISTLHVLSVLPAPPNMSVQVKDFLQLLKKVLKISKPGDALHRAVSCGASVASSYVRCGLYHAALQPEHVTQGRCQDPEDLHAAINNARKELLGIWKSFQNGLGNESTELMDDCAFIGSEPDLDASKLLVDMLSQFFQFEGMLAEGKQCQISQEKRVILGLSIALLLCSGREECFHFISAGGMEQLALVFGHNMQSSKAITLLVLGVIEQATQYSIGCEGFLGWFPREDGNIPSASSEGYSQLLKLILKKPHHDIASLATYVLHRLRFYEVVSRYEFAVLSLLEGLSAATKVTRVTLDMLVNSKLQLKNLVKLINSRTQIEDPSPAPAASSSLLLGQTEGLLSYKATSGLIASSKSCFSNCDIDSHLLALLEERGFLPLSAALLSSSLLDPEVGPAMDIYVDIVSSIQAIILSLLFCRSGLIFLSQHPELSTTLINALKGADTLNKQECVPIRYAYVLISKGFLCDPCEVGMVVEMHLRVISAIDRLLALNPHSEEYLWVLWELCGLARSDCGRQAVLALSHFPEVISSLIEALHSAKESELVTKNTGAFLLNLPIFHLAAQIFEVIVADSTSSSLCSWIGRAMDLHRALHSASPGSNRNDAPIRLLEWIDAAVFYHKHGAIALLRYAAVLASGGDAHLSSTSILVSDLTDVENVVGDSSSGSDTSVMENLGKITSEKSFDGVVLRDSSIAQLTTALRILSFISENPTVTDALYHEGAITVLYAVLVNCRFMLERSSNNYDYLVDEGAECNSTSDLLSERNREQSLIDLLVPSLVLLITLMRKLQEAKEQYRNTELLNALLRLHREVSPRLAACASYLSTPYPSRALGFGAVNHLVASALAYWPVYGWAPGLFHSLIASVQATSSLALGPKETCSLLCLLNDLLPGEGMWLWKDGMPLLTALRTLAVGTFLGPRKESEVNWYLRPAQQDKLLAQLVPQLDKIAQVIQKYAILTVDVIQDMMRVFVIRVLCRKADSASLLLQPLLSWISECVSDSNTLSETDAYKVYRFLDFLSGLLEHPDGKALLMQEGAVQLLTKVLESCFDAAAFNEKQLMEIKSLAKFTPFCWCLPALKCFALLCSTRKPLHNSTRHDLYSESLKTEDYSLILSYLLKFCQVLPAGRELATCLTVFKEVAAIKEGRSALTGIFNYACSSIGEVDSEKRCEVGGPYNLLNGIDWRTQPPFLCCLNKLLRSVDSKDSFPSYVIEAITALCLGSLRFCIDGKSLDLKMVAAVKFFFGFPGDMMGEHIFPEENESYICELSSLLRSMITDDHGPRPDAETTLYQLSRSAESLLQVLQKPRDSIDLDDILSSISVSLSSDNLNFSLKICQLADGSTEQVDEYLHLEELGDKFLWECPETLPDRVPERRRTPSTEGPNRRSRGDNSPAEFAAQNSRGFGPSTSAAVPTRRDTFRQRKPNTSRPPSMHVDDYVARERNVDGISNSNVIAVPRMGSGGGRPPSIHVDEFMARQRERQNATATVGEPMLQARNAAPMNDADTEKSNKSKQLKTELDDDLQGIDIVFDGEESEPDDKLLFPQPDDNLLPSASVFVERNSPHSIVEETESEVHESSQLSHMGTPRLSNVDENPSEFSSRMSASRPEMPLTREPSVSSDKKYFDQSDDTKNAIPMRNPSGYDSLATASSSAFPASGYDNASASAGQLPVDSRLTPNIYAKNGTHPSNLPLGRGSQGVHDQKSLPNQPPLPPMPPPPTATLVRSQCSDQHSSHSPFIQPQVEMQLPNNANFQVQADYLSRNSISSPSGSGRPLPPLPPTPPPFLSSPYNMPSLNTSTSQASMYHQHGAGTTDQTSGPRLNSYAPPSAMPPLIFNRPSSNSMSIYGSGQTQQHGENSLSILQNLPIPLSSIPPIHPFTQLQPLQPPQLPRPPQPPQHLRPPTPAAEQLESLQPPVQMQAHPTQVLQQVPASPMQGYYQPQQQEYLHAQQQHQTDRSQGQVLHQQAEAASHQQHDAGISLHEYFKSPEAIQSLLSDREKLCQLLEQHPKLMHMLQERLGQL